MKKILIIQQDSAYFLHETLQTLEKNHSALKEFQVCLLAASSAWSELLKVEAFPLTRYVTTSEEEVKKNSYDFSINLSMNESAWTLQNDVIAARKIGPCFSDGKLQQLDVWSTYLLTLKAGAPFLAFHLQDIYRNIIGIKTLPPEPQYLKNHQRVVVTARINSSLMSLEDQSKMFGRLHLEQQITIKDISEIDTVSDLSRYIYIGPASLEAIHLCENGAQGIFLTGHFQGMNLIPYHGTHHLISSNGNSFAAHLMYPVLVKLLNKEISLKSDYPLYELINEYGQGPYWKSLSGSDEHYPIYQAYVVLWNFLLKLQDSPLEIITCSVEQKELINQTQIILKKVIRLHDYALVSIDTIFREIKSPDAKIETIEGHLKNLRDMDKIFDQLAASNSLLRPLLDFYRLRRGQLPDGPLLEQVQDCFLTYNEEHHALSALDELFSVTLKKNEVTI